jgi:hypothetical protein
MFFVGSVLLLALYFDLAGLIYTLAALVIFEAVTNLRIVKLLIHLSVVPVVEACDAISPTTARTSRFNFDAERAWQLSLGPILIFSYLLGNTLWFIPWFIAFSVAGAGLSGVCPWLIALRTVGFR